MTGQYINGHWEKGCGELSQSINPATGKVIWQGNLGTPEDVDAAVQAAQKNSWASTSLQERIDALHRFEENLKKNKKELTKAISQEVGKPLWEAETEVNAMIGKVAISIKAYSERCSGIEHAGGATRFKPHGIVAVLGPYNFPGHLPNGHIVPAILAGNSVIFKPSHYTPLTAEIMIKAWDLPPGVINLIHGSHPAADHLAHHPQINGLFFTGSYKTGLMLSTHFGKHPEKILALEMGGNNPLVIGKIKDSEAAILNTLISAFITSGQRCSCARRLIVEEGNDGDQFLCALIEKTKQIIVGTPETDVFMGPVISSNVAEKLMETQSQLKSFGGKTLLPMQQDGAFLTPGLIDVTQVKERSDEEHFGPLLQIVRVKDFKASIKEANNTRYGLSAGLLSDSREQYEQFFAEVHAGIINWNQPIVGASSTAPFGGIGFSGNHRPSAYFACDYCSYPVASTESETLKAPKEMPGLPH